MSQQRLVIRLPLIAVLALPLSGCAALESKRHTDSKLDPGLGYYLPNGDIRVTLTVSSNGSDMLHDFAVDTLYFPDAAERYSVTVPKNILGATEATIKVSEAGLLQSVTYTYEPQILQAMASIPTPQPASLVVAAGRDGGCKDPGDYVAILSPRSGGTTLCGYYITVSALGSDRSEQPRSTYARARTDTDHRGPTNGLYFRMNLPYRVDVRTGKEADARTVWSDIALSPTGASTLFVQTHRSLFATVSGAIKFHHGVLVSFAPKSTSELETAAKLPATILKSYFNAVNSLFVLRRGAADSETEYMTALENMRKAKSDLDACMAAQASGNQTAITAACQTAQPQQ